MVARAHYEVARAHPVVLNKCDQVRRKIPSEKAGSPAPGHALLPQIFVHIFLPCASGHETTLRSVS